MPIRNTTSGGLSARSLSSFLSGYVAQAQQIQYANEDNAYKTGQTTDDDYVKELKSRLPGMKPVQAATLQNTINDIQVGMQRTKIQSLVDAGATKDDGTKYTAADSAAFEKSVLDTMSPGSTAYFAQQQKVQNANNTVINLARTKLTQAAQDRVSVDGSGRPATLRDIANFETNMLNAYAPGTPEHDAQTLKVQDATRNADKQEYQDKVATEDAMYNQKLQLAKDAKNPAQFAQLVQDHNQVVIGRLNNFPQYFQDANGNPDSNFYQAQADMTAKSSEATNFATTEAQAAETAGKKAQSDLITKTRAVFEEKTAEIDKQIKDVQNDQALSGKDAAATIAGLNQQKAQMLNGQVDAQGNHIPGTGMADFYSQLATTTGDPTYAKQALDLQVQAQSAQDQFQNYSRLASGDPGVVEEYDTKTGTRKAVSINSFDANGNTDISGYNGGKSAFIPQANGTKAVVQLGNTQGQAEAKDSNGNLVHYIVQGTPGKGGQVFAVPLDSHTFKPNGDAYAVTGDDLQHLAMSNPSVYQSLGFKANPDGTPIQPVTQKENQTSDQQLSVNTTGVDPNAQPGAATQTVSGALQGDVGKVNQAVTTENTGLNSENENLSGQVSSANAENAGLHQTVADLNDKTNKLLSDNQALQVKSGSYNDALKGIQDQLKASNGQIANLQNTVKDTQLQHAATIKQLQDAQNVLKTLNPTYNPQDTNFDAAKYLQGVSNPNQPLKVDNTPAPNANLQVKDATPNATISGVTSAQNVPTIAGVIH